MNTEDKERLIAILNDFETRSNKDIQFLMEIAFKAGERRNFLDFKEWFNHIKREILDL